MIIDTHLHLWDLEASDYSWLGPQHGPLHRTFTPAEAHAELAAAGIDQAILVQAEDSLTDTDHLLGIAAACDWVYGVVGWLPLTDPDAAADELDHRAALRGVRHLVHDDPREDFLGFEPVRRSLKMLVEYGLAFDVPDAWPRHLDQIVDLAQALPGLTIVVDHLAKPPRGSADLPAWAACLRRVAECPNTVAKLSGLHVPGQPYTAQALDPVLDLALELFGPRRLMYGGDWPIAIAEHNYREVLRPIRDLVESLSPTEQEEIWSQTALRTYGGSNE